MRLAARAVVCVDQVACSLLVALCCDRVCRGWYDNGWYIGKEYSDNLADQKGLYSSIILLHYIYCINPSSKQVSLCVFLFPSTLLELLSNPK